MTNSPLSVSTQAVLASEHFQQLLTALSSRGYQVIGPTVRDHAIVYDTLTSVTDLPIGYTDEQDGGTYRLKKRADAAWFGYNVGPHSWKKFLHPPVVRLGQARRMGNGHGFEMVPENHQPTKYAFLGVRSCELHAIAIQDTVFLTPGRTDPTYQSRRSDLCMIAVNCGQAGGTCFCTTVEDVTDLSGQQAERWRKWDSCFTMDFSYLVGGSVRASPRSRYRQWMTHKLASWIDQFGTSGCVGCGRCITWCPVGIDITEEVRAIRESESAPTQAVKEQ